MIIALASPRVASSVEEGLDKIKQSLSEGAAQGAEIVCFPEAYLPGLRGLDFEVPPFDQERQEQALLAVRRSGIGRRPADLEGSLNISTPRARIYV